MDDTGIRNISTPQNQNQMMAVRMTFKTESNFFLTHLNEAYNSSALHLSEYELYERTIKLITFLIC